MKTSFDAQIQHIPTDRLKPYPNNVKQHPAAQIQKIVSSIAEFGFTQPILVDADFVVIAGHGRLAAAQQMQLRTCPCIVRNDLTPAQVKALRIADNRIAEDSPWNEAALMAELESLASLDFDLTLTGWDSIDLTAFDDENGTEYQPSQTVGTAPRMPSERRSSDFGDDSDAEDDPTPADESPAAPTPVGDKYPLAIVLSSGEFKEWKALKEAIGEKQDKTAFLKLMRSES